MRDGWACWITTLVAIGKVWRVGYGRKIQCFSVASMCLFFFEIYKRGL